LSKPRPAAEFVVDERGVLAVRRRRYSVRAYSLSLTTTTDGDDSNNDEYDYYYDEYDTTELGCYRDCSG
jgi:hypothetical protein